MPVAAAIKATTALEINTVAKVIDNMANAITSTSTSSCHALGAAAIATSGVAKANIEIANATLAANTSGISQNKFCNGNIGCDQSHGGGSGCDDGGSDDILTATLLAAAVAAVNNKGFQQTTNILPTNTSAIQNTIKSDTQLVKKASIPTTSYVTSAIASGTTNVISYSLSAKESNSMMPTTTNSCTVTPTTTTGQLLLKGIVSDCANSTNNSNNIHVNSSNNMQHMLNNDDERALHLALELSLVNMNDTNTLSTASATSSASKTATLQYFQNLQQLHQEQLQQQQQQHITKSHQQQFDMHTISTISAAVAAAAAAANQQQQTQQSINGSNYVSSTTNMCHTSQVNNQAHSFLNASSNTPALSLATVTSGLLPPTLEERSKKSQNMTECVPVPSSEHVAEIVGRQGCKIKALRAKTNTYIKTPVRGEEPVFVVTGRKEDVAKAKREILSAAEHFSLIRATRKPPYDGVNNSLINNANVIGNNVLGNAVNIGNNSIGNNNNGCSSIGKSSLGGQITIQVRVPYRVVGLVVGPKGATIKHIQQETRTYIVTPSREKEPIFEVTGLPDNVQAARKQIEAHIAFRTGSLLNSANASNGLSDKNVAANTICNNNNNNNHSNIDNARIIDPALHTINTLSQILCNDINTDFLASFYKNEICSTLDYSDTISNDNNVATADLSNAPSLNLNSQLLLNSTLMTGSQQQTYSNDYLETLIINNNSNLDIELQGQNLNMPQQEQHVSKLTSRSNNALHNINTFNITGVRDNIRGHTTSSTAAAVTNSNTDMSINGSIITRSCSSASSTSSNKSLQSNNNLNCALNDNNIGAINTNRIEHIADNNMAGSSSSNSSSSSSNSSTASSRPELINIWKYLGESTDVDEGIGESPNIWATNLANSLQSNAMIALNGTGVSSSSAISAVSGVCASSHNSPNNSNSPTDSLLGETHTNLISTSNTHNPTTHNFFCGNDNGIIQVQPQQKAHSLYGITANINAGVATSTSTVRRDCMVCNEKEVIAALVPCGHNMFCMECANRICLTESATCPVCSVNVYHAMRILA